ncbi:hypothetical protein [Marinomonas primoryensis]|jgi:hypothetical protein|uniref:hypothetical protein n=1 Tax=Marinomonas primoryensis TaxID=178399 RepID=UPI0037039B70
MSRIAYKKTDECWVDNKGARKDVYLIPDETDYYYLVDSLGLIFRCFDSLRASDETLGIIYDFNGDKISDIPPFVPLSYVGLKSMYKSRVSWIQGYKEGCLILVISCTELKDFRTMLNVKSMKFMGFESNVR